MKDLRHLEAHRLKSDRRYGHPGYAFGGVFIINCPSTGRDLRVIASSGGGWDHVSVSLASRTPTWSEMDHIKKLFFEEYEAAMQLHVPVKDHINIHSNCLHLWRPTNREIPMPPTILV